MGKNENSKDYVQKAEELLEPIMQKNGFELVDVEYVKESGTWKLCIYVDKEGGITIEDCEKVNREFGGIMDREDFIPDSYILEVGSPGLGRQLKKEKDFNRSMGEDVEVKLYRPIPFIEGGKEVKTKELVGILMESDKDSITLGFGGDEKLKLLKKDIAIVRLALDF
jgi:ribosome maturation factor RimP